MCSQKQIESEYHFLLCCPAYMNIRNKYFKHLSWPNMNTFSRILTSSSPTIILNTAKYLRDASILRENQLQNNLPSQLWQIHDFNNPYIDGIKQTESYRMVTLSASLQAPIQAFFRPAMCIPCFKFLRSHKEKWRTSVSKQEFRTAVLVGIESVMRSEENTEEWDVQKEDNEGNFLRILAFTKSEWLDIMEIKYKDGYYEVRSFSSGLIPLCIPCACLCNLLLCFAPFSDTGLNKRRMDKLREAMTVDVTVE